MIFLFSASTNEKHKTLLNVQERFTEGELKLKHSPEETMIVHALKKRVEYLGFHFNGRGRRPKDKAVKKFKPEIKHRIRRQQPKNLEMVMASINPVIRGWGSYFKDGTVINRFEELHGYVRARLRSFRAKKRTCKVILYTFPKPELEKMDIVLLSSLLE